MMKGRKEEREKERERKRKKWRKGGEKAEREVGKREREMKSLKFSIKLSVLEIKIISKSTLILLKHWVRNN